MEGRTVVGLQTIWSLTPEAIRDIEATHDDAAAIYRLLSTHSNYWGPKIVARTGVKKNTVHQIARNYLRLLRSVEDNTFTGRGIDLETARRMYQKYKTLIEAEDTEPMLERVR
ncbi:MAG: hypothetical protein C0465_25780 [Ralstonia sp.]|nr:hypothetical protein [Ralstonia sp.]